MFISYARRDSALVDVIVAELERLGIDVWIDRQDIPLTADFLLEVEQAIASADLVVFMLSGHSIESRMCSGELDTARRLGKRIIPVQLTALPPDVTAPPLIANLNWIPYDPNDSAATARAIRDALGFDQAYVHAHTWLVLLTKDWLASGRRSSGLLRGQELRRALAWLASSERRDPPPTTDQRAFIQASVRRRGWTRVIAASIALLLSVAIGVAIWLDYQGRRQRTAEGLQARALQVVSMLDGARQREALEQVVDVASEWHRRFGLFPPRLRDALVHALVRVREIDAWKSDGPQVVALAVHPISGEFVTAYRTSTDEAGEQPIGAVRSPTPPHQGRLIRADLALGDRVDLCPRGTCLIISSDERLTRVVSLSGVALLSPDVVRRYQVSSADATASADTIFAATRTGRLLKFARALPPAEIARWPTPVELIVLRPDERALLIGLQSGRVLEHSLTTKRDVEYPGLRLRPRDAFTYVTDGTVYVASAPGEIYQHRPWKFGELLARVGSQRLSQIRSTADGDLIAAGTDTDGLAFLIRADGSMRFDGGLFVGIAPRMAFSNDGQRLYASGYIDVTLRTLDVHDEATLRGTMAHRAAIWQLAFCDDAARVAWGDDRGSIGILDASSQRPIREWPAPHGRVEQLACGSGVVVALHEDGVIRSYDAETGRERRSWYFNARAHDLAEVSDKGFFAAVGKSIYEITWSGDPLKLFDVQLDDAFRLAIDRARDHVAVGSSGAGYIEIRKLSDRSVTAQKFRAHSGFVNDLAFRPWDGLLLSAGTFGGAQLTPLSLWSPSGTRLGGVNAHVTFGTAIAFSTRERLTLTGGSDGKVRVWDESLVKVGPDLMSHGNIATSITVSRAAIVVTSGGDGTIAFHDLSDEGLMARAYRRVGK